MSLTLMLNGQTRSFDALEAGTSLADLVTALGLKGDRIALEWNGAIVSRAKWPETRLEPGDKLEMVHFVGGGCGTPLLSSKSMQARSGASASNAPTWPGAAPQDVARLIR